LAGHAEHALNAAHTGTFIIRIDDSFLFGFGVGHAWIKHPAATTALATVLLFAFWVMPVLDNVLALAMGTAVRDLGAYHIAYFTPSLEILPLPPVGQALWKSTRVYVPIIPCNVRLVVRPVRSNRPSATR
jgi:hypothetical protein